MRASAAVLVLLAILGSGPAALACDLCSFYSSARAQGDSTVGFHGGFAEQLTHFGTLQQDGKSVTNSANQRIDSSVSQFFFAYNVDETTSIQLNLPIIYRSYRTPTDSGTVSGPGDVALIGKYAFYRSMTEDRNITLSTLAGFKLPTGSFAQLRSVLTEDDDSSGGTPNAVGGHDLTLGTGSYDGILGLQGAFRWGRAILSAQTQLTIRTIGAYSYQFADDLTFRVDPGYLLALEHDHTISLSWDISGETKGDDQLNGVSLDDTAITAVFTGPQLGATFGERFAASVGVELPLVNANSSLQLVADSRVRGSVVVQF
jgi:hypothetical protein